jgi:hypothetical protein
MIAMTVILKRQLTDPEKQKILQRFGRRCFATGHQIADDDLLQFDHIRAYTIGGVSELDNIAPMCDVHNRAKGVLPLDDFRIKLRLEGLFGGRDSLTLKDLLKYLQEHGDIPSYGQSMAAHPSGEYMAIEWASGKSNHSLYECPTTGWRYFYATLPIVLLDSDDDEDHHIGLQPRFLIMDKVFVSTHLPGPAPAVRRG